MLNIDFDEYFDVYRFESEIIKNGRTLLPTGVGILYKKDILGRIGDTYIDKFYNLYLIDMKDNKKIYKKSLMVLVIWLAFLLILATLSFFKLQRIDVNEVFMFIFILFVLIISSLLFMASWITFLFGVNCYGIEVYEPRIRKRTNQCINLLIFMMSGSLVVFLIL